MSRRQKITLSILGALVGVLALALAIVLLLRDDTASKVAAAATTTTTIGITGDPTTTSTVVLQPVDTAPPTTAPPTTTTTRPPPTTTTAAPQGRIVTAKDAVLVPPSSPTTQHLDDAAPCSQLSSGKGWSATCGKVNARGGTVIWLVEEKALAKGATARRAAVWRATGAAGTWQELLQAKDDDGSEYSSVNEKTGDTDGDGIPELLFGFRRQGTGQILAVDIVDGNAKVLLHDTAAKGAARVPAGELDTWSAVYPNNEPTCCPPAYEHDTIKLTGGVWRVVSSETVPPASVPPSQV